MATIATLQASEQIREPFVSLYFGIQYSGLKALVSPVVHPLWPSREHRLSTRLAAKPRAHFIGPAQCPIIAILAL
jgi:hypothetical protein